MDRQKLTNNLWLDEYIPKALYFKWKHKPHRLIGLLDKELIIADQMLRDHFGVVTINNWWTGGQRNWSGIRTLGSSYYSETSQHTYGRASDKIFKNATAEEVRAYIIDNWQELGITCIEMGVNWVHSDTRWWRGNKLLKVYP